MKILSCFKCETGLHAGSMSEPVKLSLIEPKEKEGKEK